MRILLILFLIHGLAPGIGELVESVVHRMNTGHFAHAPNDPHDETNAPEHGCGATAHRCPCCPTMPAVARAGFCIDRPALMRSEHVADRSDDRAEGIITGVFRPPIV